MFWNQPASRLLIVVTSLAVAMCLGDSSRAAPLERYEGIITVVGRYAVSLEDPRDLTRRNFAVNQSTKIMRNGTLARYADLRIGDAAQVSFRPLGDKLVALTITAMSPP